MSNLHILYVCVSVEEVFIIHTKLAVDIMFYFYVFDSFCHGIPSLQDPISLSLNLVYELEIPFIVTYNIEDFFM